MQVRRFRLNILHLFVLALFGALVPACSTPERVALPSDLAAQSAGEYRLGLGDRLRVNVHGERDLSGEFQVTGAGVVTMPLIGDMPAVGLTARELEANIVRGLSNGYLRNPSVSVEVYEFRPYFVLGEVGKPGRYPTLEGTTIVAAIATAGGYTYRADKRRIYIRRAGTAQEFAVDPNQAVMVAPGDVIRVGERRF